MFATGLPRSVRILSRASTCRMGLKEARYDRRVTSDSLPLRRLLATLAGWVNRYQ